MRRDASSDAERMPGRGKIPGAQVAATNPVFRDSSSACKEEADEEGWRLPRRYPTKPEAQSSQLTPAHAGDIEGFPLPTEDSMRRAVLLLASLLLASLPLFSQTYAPPKYLVSDELFKAVAQEYSGAAAKEKDRKSTRLNSSHGY